MNTSTNDIYVLGTGLSHDGSACILKNGVICAAIEKERLTRIKHDGGNDDAAIRYCLDQAGITINDVNLIVQQSLYGEFLHGNSFFDGPRPIPEAAGIPVISISHHLAHAYYAIGTCPFDETAVFVLDGAGSFYHECIDLDNGAIAVQGLRQETEHLFVEKDSFYLYKDGRLTTVYKDFSPLGRRERRHTMLSDITTNSIGSVYSAASLYCFGNLFDTGKLMGLAPYGRPGVYDIPIFELRDGRVFETLGNWHSKFKQPVLKKGDLYNNFQYYADIAYWIQKETERAIDYVIKSRKKLVSTQNLCYTGGVALNAVANALLLKNRHFENIYLTPAAGDNGIAIGCAYYGWLEILKRKRELHNGSSCFGKTYSNIEIQRELSRFIRPGQNNYKLFIDTFFKMLAGFVNKKALVKQRYLIRFLISDVGHFPVLFEAGRVIFQANNEYTGHADCLVFADAETFVRSLNSFDYLSYSLRENKAVLTGDIRYFAEAIDLENLYGRVVELIKEDPAFEPFIYERSGNIIQSAAKLLSQGKVIAWFQEGSEFGPRALGNRSILADPRLQGVKQFINNKIKFREDFRPFAPAVMREHISEYFDFSGESPYMILVAQARDEWKDKIPDVVHVDNSSRIQTVSEQISNKFYQLLKEFKKLTGIPILLNTSFNMKGMPIIETPNEALNFFFECALDYLILNDVIVSKTGSLPRDPVI